MKNKILPVFLVVFIIIIISVFTIEGSNLENKYLNYVRQAQHSIIKDTSDVELLSKARYVCSSLDSGTDIKDLIFKVSGAKDFSQETLVIYGAIIVESSIKIFCPEYLEQTESWVY